jgi:hypothetical protein
MDLMIWLSYAPDDGEEPPGLTAAEFAESQDEPLPPECAGYRAFGSDPDDLANLAAGSPPGPHTLPSLTVVPVGALSAAARSQALSDLERLSSHVEGLKNEFIAEIAGPAPTSREAKLDDFAAQEVSAATRCSVYQADAKIGVARDLARNFRATREAMKAGNVTGAQARAMTDAFAGLEPELRGELEANMLKFSHRQNLTNFRRSLNRWRAKKDPHFESRAEKARREVVVEHHANDDGTGELIIKGPLEHTHLIDLALASVAQQTKPDLGGTVAERKFAALRDWADVALTGPGAPTHHGMPIRVQLVTYPSTVLGHDEHPVEIPGVGFIPAPAMRWALADGAEIQKLLVEKRTGYLRAVDPTVYHVAPQLADVLISRYVTSAAPHSNVSAAGCDMEHNIPHPAGPSDEHNLTPVCRRWHRAKTHGDWTYTKDPDTAIITWRSPTGLRVEIDPYDYRNGP